MATSTITGMTPEQQKSNIEQNIKNTGGFAKAVGNVVYPFIDPTDPLNYLGLFGRVGRMMAVAGTAMSPQEAEAVVGKRFITGTPTSVPMFGKAYEISDKFSTINPEALARITQIVGGGGKLKELLSHPGLYRDYPELANMDVKSLGLFSDPGTRAAYGEGTVYLPRTTKDAPTDKLKQIHSDLLHEVQHAIQQIDKMPRGASPRNFLPENITQSMSAANKSEELSRNSLNEYLQANYGGSISWADALFKTKKFTTAIEADKQAQALVKQYEYSRKLRTTLENKVSTANQTYEKVAGEAQARAVQKRFENPEQYARPFTESYDKPLLDLIQSPLDYSIK